jgi:hypothetical protein
MESVAAPLDPDRALTAHKVLPDNGNNGPGRPSTRAANVTVMAAMPWTETGLYRRGCATLVASWTHYADGSEAAAVHRLPGVDVAVFARGPERSVYNNALLRRGLPAAGAREALGAMEAAYEAAGVHSFAAWVHDSDDPTRIALEARGYTLDTTTRAMAMPLRDLSVRRPGLATEPGDWREYLAMAGLPPDFLRTADARDRGCETASLQSTPMAERLYAALGFRDLGRFLEYVPPGSFIETDTATLLRPPGH